MHIQQHVASWRKAITGVTALLLGISIAGLTGGNAAGAEPDYQPIQLGQPTSASQPAALIAFTPFAAAVGCDPARPDKHLVSFYSADPNTDPAARVVDSQCLSSTEATNGPSAEAIDSIALPSGQHLVGWHLYDPATQTVDTSTVYDFSVHVVTAASDLAFVPVIDSRCYIIYISAGTQVTPEDWSCGGPSQASATVPQRDGYLFDGWYAADGTKYDFSEPLTGDIILTAGWTGKTVPYSLAVWVEKAGLGVDASPWPVGDDGYLDFSDYEYVTTYTGLTGTAGQPTGVGLTSLPAAVQAWFTSVDQTQPTAILKYGDAVYVSKSVVQGDGSTVVNLFVNRKVYTYTFSTEAYAMGGSTTTPISTSATMVINGVTYGTGSNGYPKYSFQAKYEDDVIDKWPTNGGVDDIVTFQNMPRNASNVPYVFHTWGVGVGCATCELGRYSSTGVWQGGQIVTNSLASRRIIIDSSLLPRDGAKTDLSFRLDVMTDPVNQYRYYLEVPTITDQGQCVASSGYIWYRGTTNTYKCYKEQLDYRQLMRPTYAKQINGMKSVNPPHDPSELNPTDFDPVPFACTPQTAAISTCTRPGSGTQIFFYDYLYFDLDYQTSVVATNQCLPPKESKMFDQPIRADGVELAAPTQDPCNGYKFLGWYRDPTLNVPFDPTVKMPLSGATAYAKWESTDNLVTFYYNKNMVESNRITTPQGVADGAFVTGGESAPLADFRVGQFVPGRGVFQGWYFNELVETGQTTRTVAAPFSFDMAIYQDYDVYATWRTSGYRLWYDLDDGTINGVDAPPVDGQDRNLGTSARVLSPQTTVNGTTHTAVKGSQTFVAWQLEGTNDIYYPGQLVPILAPDQVLRAMYVPLPKIVLEKSVDPEVVEPTQHVTYTFRVTNDGPTDLTDIVLTDNMLSPFTCAGLDRTTVLAPKASVLCSVSYQVPDGYSVGDTVVNLADVSATSTDGYNVVDDDDAELTIGAPDISLVKTVSPTSSVKLGDEVAYSFVITNTGTVDLFSVVLVDAMLFPGATDGVALSTLDCSPTDRPKATWAEPLAVDGSLTCVVKHTVDVGDVTSLTAMAWVVENTATVRAESAVGTEVTDDDTAELGVTKPTLGFDKSADTGYPPNRTAGQPAEVNQAADPVTYTFTVHNPNLVPVNGVTIVEDDFTGSGDSPQTTSCKIDNAIVTLPVDLPAGKSLVCVATYLVTQPDLDAGQVYNQAHATGNVGSGDKVVTVESDKDDETVVNSDPDPELDFAKTADPLSVDAVDDEVTFIFETTNVSQVTVRGVHVEENEFTGSGSGGLTDWSCQVDAVAIKGLAADLAPGQTLSCTAKYQVTQQDLDRGGVRNQAHAHGTVGDKDYDSPPDDVTVDNSDNDPALGFTKTVTPKTVTAEGQTVTYTFTATNNGQVTINDVKVREHESEFTGTGTHPVVGDCRVLAEGAATGAAGVAAPTGSADLAPGQSLVCTAAYAVTQADVDAGQVTNVAHAAGVVGDDPVSSDPDTQTVTSSPSKELVFDKSVSPKVVTKAGQSVTYTFTTTNVGTSTVSGVRVVEESFSGTGEKLALSCTVDGKAAASSVDLGPGKVLVCTAVYALTQADIDAEKVTNWAHAEGTVSGVPVKSNSDDETVTSEAPKDLGFDKSVSPATVSRAAEQVEYTFTTTNNGELTVSNVHVVEDQFSGTGTLLGLTCRVDGQVSPNSATLAPGQSLVCTAAYAVTQDDVDAGKVTNRAHAEGKVGNTTVSSDHDDSTVTTSPSKELVFDKSVSPKAVTKAGQSVTYTFTTTNSGTSTVSGVRVVEESFSGTGEKLALSCTVDGKAAASSVDLGPGKVLVCTAVYALTQADIDAEKVTNWAHAEGTVSGVPVKSNSDDETVTSEAPKDLGFDKSVSPATVSRAAEQVEYTFTTTNNGELTVSNVHVVEDQFSGTGTLLGLTCQVDGQASPNSATLAPGQSLVCTAAYAVTQDDVDAGQVTNRAHAEGKVGNTTVSSDPDDSTVTSQASKRLDFVKSASPVVVSQVGQPVEYVFTATNNGELTITGVHIEEDSFSGTGKMSGLSCRIGQQASPSTATLAPGESLECVATYLVTQADLDAEQVVNIAHAAGVVGRDPIISTPDDAVVTSSASSGLDFTKTVSPDEVSRAGQQVEYRFAATNNGELTMTGVRVEEEFFSGAGELLTMSCQVDGADIAGLSATLAPGRTLVCVALYTVVQADLDAGEVVNQAHAKGKVGNTDVTSDPDDAVVTSTAPKELGFVKSASPEEVSRAGQRVEYLFTATNNGELTMTGVHVVEDSFSGTGQLSGLSCQVEGVDIDGLSACLAPGESLACTGVYRVTQADVDAGQVVNWAHATGLVGNTNVVSNPDDAVVKATASTGIDFVKFASPQTVSREGQPVTYRFTATNNGELTMTGVQISEDDFSGTGALSSITCQVDGQVSLSRVDLAPGQSLTCTAVYEVTQADIDAGQVVNRAHAAGWVGGDPLTSDPDDTTVVTTTTPRLSLIKSASPASVSHQGQPVTYHFTTTNEGHLTVAGVHVVEDDFSGTGTLSALECQVDGRDAATSVSLAPGQSLVCTATYAVSGADLDADRLTNVAHATGKVGNTNVDSDPDDATVVVRKVPVVPQSGLSVAKTGPTVPARPGEVLTYTITATNTGDTTLTGVGILEQSVTDQQGRALTPGATLGACHYGANSLSRQPANGGAVLAPNQTWVCTATYQVPADAVASGLKTVANTATASGKDPDGDDVTPPEPGVSQDTPIVWPLVVAKSVDKSTATLGDQLVFTITVTNNSSIVMNDVAIVDDGVLVDGRTVAGASAVVIASCSRGGVAVSAQGSSLQPGESIVCLTAPYRVTEAELAAGDLLTNTATASGTPPERPDPVTTTSDPTHTTLQRPPPPQPEPAVLTLDKSADPTTVSARGQQITYTFVAKNEGGQTLNNVTISDPMPGLSQLVCVGGDSLAVGASMTCTATYRVTLADLNRGRPLVNTATATADPADGSDLDPVTDQAVVVVEQLPALVVEKLVDQADASAGDLLTYTVRITNTGNVTVNYEIEDTFSGLGPWSKRIIGCVDAVSSGQLTLGQTLAPDQTVLCTFAPYTVVVADLANDTLVNHVRVTGTPVDGPDDRPTATDEDDVTTELLPVIQVPTNPQVPTKPHLPTGGTVATPGAAGGGGAFVALLVVAALAGAAARSRRIRG